MTEQRRRSRATPLSESLQRYRLDEQGCWIWQGYVDPNGYGRVYDPATRLEVWAHRASYSFYVGPIEPKHEIDHECQTTRCINPEHLASVTKAEHVRRTFQRRGLEDKQRFAAYLRVIGMTYEEIAEALALSHRSSAAAAVNAAVDKGLVVAEEIPRRRFLNDVEKEQVRDMYLFGVPQGVIADTFGVDNSNVSRVINGKELRSARVAVRDE